MSFESWVKEVGDEIFEEVKEKYNTDYVTKEIIKELKQNHVTAIYKLIGFDKRYGTGWEVDHCNGRSGESAFGDALKKVAVPMLEKWMNEKIQDPVFQEKAKTDLDRTINIHIDKALTDYKLRQSIASMVSDIIKKEVEFLIKQREEDIRKYAREAFYGVVEPSPTPNH